MKIPPKKYGMEEIIHACFSKVEWKKLFMHVLARSLTPQEIWSNIKLGLDCGSLVVLLCTPWGSLQFVG